jgi:TonB family protein
MSSSDDWREERLRARRQREAEEAAAAEALRAAQTAPHDAQPKAQTPSRARFPTPGLPTMSFKAPTFARRRTTGNVAGGSFSLNTLQISLIALALAVLISVAAAKLRGHHELTASANPSTQRSAMQTAADETSPIVYSAPSAPTAPEPIATGGQPVSSDESAPSRLDSAAQVIERPSEEQFAAAFPDQAGPGDYQGRVVVRCAISASAEPGGCSVISETPAGAGFGEAALGLIHKFKFRPKMAAGEAVDGGVVTVPIQFTR